MTLNSPLVYNIKFMYLVKLLEEEVPGNPLGNTLNPPREI